jgi:transcriptional regulator with XRE-family HTH domain
MDNMIKEIRKYLNLTQEEMCNRCNISKPTYIKVENNKPANNKYYIAVYKELLKELYKSSLLHMCADNINKELLIEFVKEN